MDQNSEPISAETLLAHTDYLRAIARALVRDEATADDLVQEAWLSVLARRVSEDRPRSVGAIRPWLAGLLRNLARERSRGEARRARREVVASRPESESPAQHVVDRLETFRMLAHEAARLHEPYRSAILLRFFEGLSADEIGQRLGIPAATVRSQQKRGLDELRERLDRRHGDRETWTGALIALGGARPVAHESAPIAKLALGFVGVLALGVIVLWSWRVSHRAAENRPAELALPRAESTPHPDVAEFGATPQRSESRARADVPLASAEKNLVALGVDDRQANAVVRLRVMDRRTRAPVPDYAIDVEQGNQRERVVTDALGNATTHAGFPIGDIGLHLVDHEALAAEREAPRDGSRTFRWTIPFEHRDAEEAELWIDVGPSFALDIEMPHDWTSRELTAADFVAALAPGRDVRPRAFSRAPVRANATRSDEIPAKSRSSESSAQGPQVVHAWVRFAPEAADLSTELAWALVVESLDHHVRGEVSLSNDFQANRAPIRVRMEPVTSVDLSIVDALGAPIRARVALLDLEGRVVVQQTDAQSHARFESVPRAAYLARIEPFGAARHDESLVVDSDHAFEHTIVVPMPRERVAVRGLVKAVGGSFRAPITISMRDPRNGVVLETTAKPAAESTAIEFSFDDLAPGDYVVAATSREVWRWQANDLQVHAPSDHGELVALLAPDDTAEVLVKCTEQESGARVDRFDIEVVVGGQPALRSTNYGTATLARLRTGESFTWRVRARGYELASGDERAIAVEDGRRILRASLVRAP